MADSILLFSTPELRLAICTAAALAQDASARHGLAPGSAAALGQALAGALLLAGTDRAAAAQARVDLQLECKGPLKGLLVDADGSGAVRGLVRVTELSRAGTRTDVALPGGTPAGAGDGGLARFEARPLLSTGRDEEAGLLSILRAVPDREAPHRAAYPFAGADLGAALTLYLRNERAQGGELACEVLFGPGEPLAAVSAALIWTAADGDEAARPLGKLLRQGWLSQAMLASADAGRNAHALAQELGRALSLGPLHLESEIRPRFACRCSRERVVRALSTLGAAELSDMARRDGGAEASCDFCRATYRIGAAELLELAAGEKPRD